MRILLIGGNGFIGRFAVSALMQQGHAVAVFQRGATAAPAGVEEIRGNRNQLASSIQELKRFVPDVVIDLVISSEIPACSEFVTISGFDLTSARKLVYIRTTVGLGRVPQKTSISVRPKLEGSVYV